MKVVPNPAMNDSDELLYQQMSAGSENAYYTLFERHWERLYSISVHLLDDREIAKDVIQDIFLALWENRKKQSVQNVGAYLSRAAKFASLKELRDSKSTLHDTVDLAQNLSASENSDLDAMELQQRISEVVDALPERCKEVFVLSREEHLTNKEIAEKLNLSQRTVETHISNALKHLRKNLPKDWPLLALMVFLN